MMIGWVYNGTEKNVFVAILFHAMANFVSNLFPTHGPEVSDSRAYLYLAVFYLSVALIITIRSNRKTVAATELSLRKTVS